MSSRNNRPMARWMIAPALALGLAIAGIEAARRWRQPTVSAPLPSPQGASPAAASFQREIKDAGSNTLRIAAWPHRIVSQTLATDEILLAICDASRIVAVSTFARDPKYSLAVEAAQQIPAQTDRGAEQIIQLNPDLIFVASYSRAETVELLKAAGAPVFRFANFDKIDDIKKNVRTLGYAIGAEEQAEKLVHEMEERIRNVQARLPRGGRAPRVMSYSPGGFSAGANTLFDEMIKAVGAINVSAERGLGGFPKISAEQVLEWQPDFIILGAEQNSFEETRNRLLANPAIAVTSAARAGRIVMIENRYFLTVSHHIAGTIELLAEGLYGKP